MRNYQIRSAVPADWFTARVTTLGELDDAAGSPISPTSPGYSGGPWGQASTNGAVSGV